MKRDKRKPQVRRGSPELPYPKCVYCGVRDGTQREHVVASCFFTKPFPGEIPKVPACRECNQLRGDGGERNLCDDEAYVRDRLCMQLGVDDHPAAAALLRSKALKNLMRNESARARRELVESMEPAVVPVGPGRYLYGAWSFQVDLARFERVMRKMVRGLYAHHLGRRVPDDYQVIVVPRIDREGYERSRAWLRANDPSPIYHLGADRTVSYQYASRRPSPLGHNWLVTFYERCGFYAHVGPLRSGKGDLPGE